MTFIGTVFGEDDSLSSEKISRMMADDVAIKELADRTPAGLISRESVSGVAISSASPTTVISHDFWVPEPNKIFQFRNNGYFIMWNSNMGGQRTRIKFELDGTQVFEQQGPRFTTTIGFYHNGQKTKFLMNNLSVGSHTLDVIIDVTLAAGNGDISIASEIYEFGKAVTPT